MDWVRRGFLKTFLSASAVSMLYSKNIFSTPSNYDINTTTYIHNGGKMAIQRIDLPYSYEELEPVISAQTLDFHYNKHHATYVKKTEALIKGTDLEGKSLEEVILQSYKKSSNPVPSKNPEKEDPEKESVKNTKIFDNSAQVYNHNFLWQCMKRNGGGNPDNILLKKIQEDFESLDNLIRLLSQAAEQQFGSGWAWLVYNKSAEKLEVLQTSNAYLPLVEKNLSSLLTIDVWEHAYYLDYQNERPKYINQFFEKIVNWDFASKNYNKALEEA